MPCVYDELDGWNTDLYVDYGDPFYLDMAFYDFFVEVPTDMVVAATGELIESGNDGMNVTYHFSAGLPVREVTFSASRYYQVETIMVGHVNVTSYYLPDSQPEWGDNVIQWSNRTLRLLNHTYGIYPYSTLNVVEQHAFYGGMEYPCQVYVTHGVITLMRAGQRASWYLQLVVVHEVAHQWWSQLVGGDAIDWGFLDEGLTCWSHSYYGEYYHSNWEYFQYDRYLDVSRPFYNDNGIESAINQSNYDRPELTGYIDYIKTPLVLERLRVEIGHEAFVAGLSHFFKKCYFRIGTLSALQDSMEGAFGGSLDWFFLPFFDNPRFPDYWFSNVVYNYPDSTLSLTIEDRNQDSNPYPFAQRVPLRVWGTGYQQIPSHIIFEDTVWINGTTNLILPLTGEPDEVMLIYGDYVLVELTDAGTVSLATQDIQVVGYVDPFLIYQLIVVALVGIVAIAAVGSFLRSRRT